MKSLMEYFLISIVFVTTVFAQGNTKNMDRIVLTSFYPMYIATINVTRGIPATRVINMTKQLTGCLHDYQLTPQDLKTISTAWAFVVNGGGMEVFLDKTVKQRPELKIIDASRGIALIKGPGDEGDNPHVWVSVTGAIAQVNNIAEGLAAIDTTNALLYKANGNAYIAKLEALRKKMHAGLANISSRDIITFHEAFPYFAKEFNLHIVAVIEREPGSEPSPRELAETVKIIREHKVKALFAEPQYLAGAANTIARETGCKIYVLDPCVSGPLTPDAYIQIMEKNLWVLQEALR